MSSLYLTEQGSSVFKRGKQLVIVKDSKIIARVKTFDLTQVVLFGNINISTPVIHFLLREGIELVFLSPSGKFRGRLISSYPKNVQLRKAQFKKAEDESFKLNLSRKIVFAKLSNQIEVLRREVLRGRASLKGKIEGMKSLLSEVEKVGSIDSLRGYEGRASAIYFSAFSEILKSSGWNFKGRTYHPPQDEFNSLLSFLYTLLLNQMENFLLRHSLEPILGFFHAEEYGKPALALDLMEEWRPVVADYTALKLVREGNINLEDFYRPGKESPPYPELVEDFRHLPVVLTKDGIKKIVLAFERRFSEAVNYKSKKVKIKEAMEGQVLSIKDEIMGEGEYMGFVWR